MDLKYSSDNLDIRGFIDKDMILQYVTEAQIFALVLGYEPEEYQYVTSPLRDDTHAGCWFEMTEFGMVFRDFAHGNRPLDCFNMVQQFFNIPNFYMTLQFVYNRLIANRDLSPVERKVVTRKGEAEIYFSSRNYTNSDKLFWMPYGITRQNLIDDKVFAVSNVLMKNTKTGDIKFKVREICYAFTEFPNGRKKLYFPKREGTQRFVSTCKKDDIGNVKNLAPFGKKLVITKSYKDCRVLYNQGLQVIWTQNEGAVPCADSIIPLVKRFDKVIVLYDNDSAGIKSANEICQFINSYFPARSSYIHLPIPLNQQGISDPADLYRIKGKSQLNSFLNNHVR